MKKIFFCLSLFVPFVTFSQSGGKTVTFDIDWPDETKSTIIFKDNNGFSSIIADTTIQFNAIAKTEGNYLNPTLSNFSCKNDTTIFLSAKTELLLGRGGRCYDVKYSGPDTLLFRNTKNPLLKGKLAYNVVQYEYCPLFVNNFCVGGYSGEQFISFTSYTLNSDKTRKSIAEKVVTAIDEANNTTSNSNISPNPFSTFVQVKSTQYVDFQITTLTGEVLKTHLPTNQPLDLSDLESGIYIAQFGDGVLHKRIVKQ